MLEPLWYKEAVIYEIPIRAFADGNQDGVGDFAGLTERLDYLSDLGVTALWILPFYPSPLRDDGYDIADYGKVNPHYGTMGDFKRFLAAAHERGLKVITELVLNHTSDRHPWFQRSRRSKPGDTWRDFYVWSDTIDRYTGTRIIFKDFESSNWTYDPVAGAYYWHRFYSHQPDLNFDHPPVRRAVRRIMERWLGMGVDGLRLDAVPYLYEREGTSNENLPETHAFLRELRAHVDARFTNRMLLAEANQWPEDAVAYFGQGDECHMAFHFPVMPRLFMAIRMEDRHPIVDILSQTPPIPDACQWAIFLRNHDELTLEMVTDEERDYMYRVYAADPRTRINLGIRRRLAPLLGNDRRRIELMNGLLLSFPGTPVIYYGDEIGMGDNLYLGDRNGVRTPMQWSDDRNAGFSRAPSSSLYLPVIIDPDYHYERVNVEGQLRNPHSLLWWMRRVLALRRQRRAFGRGAVEFLSPENRKVLAFVRTYEEERVLVVANLSRFAQYVQLDLERWRGLVPLEMFGGTRFPRIDGSNYVLTLGPHSFLWFDLVPAAAPAALSATTPERGEDVPTLRHEAGAAAVLEDPGRLLDPHLARWLAGQRWFGGKARTVKALTVMDSVPVAPRETGPYLLVVCVEYVEGESDVYALPIALLDAAAAEQIRRDRPRAALLRIVRPAAAGRSPRAEPEWLVDAMVVPSAIQALVEVCGSRKILRGLEGELAGERGDAWRKIRPRGRPLPEPLIPAAEQSNTNAVLGGEMILKLYRKLEPGVHPELEVSRHLAERHFPAAPRIAGWFEYRTERRDPMTVGLLLGFIPNVGDAWSFALDAIDRYVERVLVDAASLSGPDLAPPGSLASHSPVSGAAGAEATAPASEADSAAPALALTSMAAPATPPAIDLHSPRVLLAAAELDLSLGRAEPSAEARERIGYVLDDFRLIGRRTAEVHLALADSDDPGFAPEPFTPFYQRSLYQSLRNRAERTLRLLRTQQPSLEEDLRPVAAGVLERRESILRRLRSVAQTNLGGMRIRTHGDYHLGQVLRTGADFVVIDFEGEPGLSLSARRTKRSPLRDVAGMLRSFEYAGTMGMRRAQEAGLVLRGQESGVRERIDAWVGAVSEVFLRAYLEVMDSSGLLPAQAEARGLLLDVLVLEKLLYEVEYELENRPQWLRVPLRRLWAALGGDGAGQGGLTTA